MFLKKKVIWSIFSKKQSLGKNLSLEFIHDGKDKKFDYAQAVSCIFYINTS